MVLFNGDSNTQSAAYRSHHAGKECDKLERRMAGDRARVHRGMAILQGLIDENHRTAGKAREDTAKADLETTALANALPAARVRLLASSRTLARAKADKARADAACAEAGRDGRVAPGLAARARVAAARNEAYAIGGEAALLRLVAALEIAAPDHPLLRTGPGSAGQALIDRASAARDEMMARHGLPAT